MTMGSKKGKVELPPIKGKLKECWSITDLEYKDKGKVRNQFPFREPNMKMKLKNITI